MINRNKYHYKGYDIESKSRQEKKQMEIMNPYEYNLESNRKREIDYDEALKTTQDYIFPIVIQKNNK